jgi:hypothetical protein
MDTYILSFLSFSLLVSQLTSEFLILSDYVDMLFIHPFGLGLSSVFMLALEFVGNCRCGSFLFSWPGELSFLPSHLTFHFSLHIAEICPKVI